MTPWMLPSCCMLLLIWALSLVKSAHVFTCFLFPLSNPGSSRISPKNDDLRLKVQCDSSDFQVRGFCMFPRHLQSFRRYCHRRFPSDWLRCSSQECGVPEESDWWFHWRMLCAGHGAMFSGPHCAGHVSCIVLLCPPGWKSTG